MTESGKYMEPPLCECGHYLSIHDKDGCIGWDRKQRQWKIFYLAWTLFLQRRCPCKVRRLKFKESSDDSS